MCNGGRGYQSEVALKSVEQWWEEGTTDAKENILRQQEHYRFDLKTQIEGDFFGQANGG